jgi:hypothetical protein
MKVCNLISWLNDLPPDADVEIVIHKVPGKLFWIEQIHATELHKGKVYLHATGMFVSTDEQDELVTSIQIALNKARRGMRRVPLPEKKGRGR